MEMRDEATAEAIYLESLVPIARALGLKSHITHHELYGDRELTSLIIGTIRQLSEKLKRLEKQSVRRAKEMDETKQMGLFGGKNTTSPNHEEHD